MNKKVKTPHTASGNELAVKTDLLILLKGGKIDLVIVQPEMKKEELSAIVGKTLNVTDGKDSLPVMVKRGDKVSHGYLPKGYPAAYRVKGTATCLHVDLSGESAADPDEPESSTSGE